MRNRARCNVEASWSDPELKHQLELLARRLKERGFVEMWDGQRLGGDPQRPLQMKKDSGDGFQIDVCVKAVQDSEDRYEIVSLLRTRVRVRYGHVAFSVNKPWESVDHASGLIDGVMEKALEKVRPKVMARRCPRCVKNGVPDGDRVPVLYKRERSIVWRCPTCFFEWGDKEMPIKQIEEERIRLQFAMTCPNDNLPMVLRKDRQGRDEAVCSKYPACATIMTAGELFGRKMMDAGAGDRIEDIAS